MATLERREQSPGNVSYRVRWWADGKQRSKSFRSYAEAKRWKAVLEGDLVNGTFMDPKHGAVTLKTFMEEHSESLSLDLRVSTASRMAGIYRTHVIPEFGHLPLNGITTTAVSKWVTKMRASMGAATVRKNVFALRKVLELAVRFGVIRSNPASGVPLPAEPKNEQRFLSHDEAWRIAEAIHPRFRAMVLISVFGGLRLGEVSGLQVKHIDFSASTIQVKRTLVEVGSQITFGPPKTKTSVRTVTIPRSIMAEIVEHIERYGNNEPDALIFTGVKGQPIARNWWYRYYWKTATQKTHLDGLRFHDLRHTFVALWIDAGRNAKEVSKAAGHSTVAFTLDRYGHLYDRDDAGLADELDGLLGHIRPHGLSNSAQVPRHTGSAPKVLSDESNFHGGSTGSNPVGGTTPVEPDSRSQGSSALHDSD